MGLMFAAERRLRCKASLARDIAASASDPRQRREQLHLARLLEYQLRDASESYLL